MDEIEIRINKEINNFKEKFYFNLTLKQLVAIVFTALIVVPIYLLLSRFNEEIASWIVLFVGAPILGWGFFEPYNMSLFRYLQLMYRQSSCFKKPLYAKGDYLNDISLVLSKDMKYRKNKQKGKRHGKK